MQRCMKGAFVVRALTLHESGLPPSRTSAGVAPGSVATAGSNPRGLTCGSGEWADPGSCRRPRRGYPIWGMEAHDVSPYAADVAKLRTSRAESDTSEGRSARLFVPSSAVVRDAVHAAGLDRELDVRFCRDVVADVVAAHPSAADVVLLDTADLPDHAVGIASNLVELSPARVLLATNDLRGKSVLAALRMGVADVVSFPLRADDLALRVHLLQRRGLTWSGRDGDMFHLLHELTNVLGATRLTAYLVSQPELAERIGSEWSPVELAARLDAEVEQAVALVNEMERRLRLLHEPEG